MILLTPYFDFNDLENPIKYQLSDLQYLILDSSYFYVSNVKIRKNLYTLYDSVFGFSSGQSGTFYSYESSNAQTLFPFENILARIDIQLDAQVDRYERTVQTIFEAIGTIGGIYEILRIIIGTIVGIFVNKVYQQTTVNDF